MTLSRDPIIPERLETPRLTLRMFEEADWDALHEMFSDEDCVRYTIGAPLNRWQTWRTLASYLGHWQLRGYGPYAVVERSTSAMMGAVGLWFPGEWPEPEIKWSLAQRFWGSGFATEAASAVRDMAAVHFKWTRLISLVLPANERSKAVALRLGARFEKSIPFRDTVTEMFVYDLAERRSALTTLSPGTGIPVREWIHPRGRFVASTDPARLDLDLIHGVLRETYWSPGIPRGIVCRAIAGSIAFGVYATSGGQVGFARVVTDRATFAYLADVFIVETERGRGLGKWLMSIIVEHPDLQNLRRWLLGTRDAHALYAQFGFTPLGAPERFMERHDPNVYARLNDAAGPRRGGSG
jgi:RimJ/RimL family protein N-acetyltransferase